MKHVIFGGNGFTGKYLAKDLIQQGQQVLICDLERDDSPIYGIAQFRRVNIQEPGSLTAVKLQPDDIVHHLAARQYHLQVPRRRSRFFEEVNYQGTANILSYLEACGCLNMIFFSTDMVYGYPQTVPMQCTHPRHPLGPYGQSKRKAEELCELYRAKGFNITIFRPRLIVGPGRLGVLAKLFRLIEANLPVPLIGNGQNHYQMISIFDCVSAVNCAIHNDIPKRTYNLGSKNPPTVRNLLKGLIKKAGSTSTLIYTPAWVIKPILFLLDGIGAPVLYREQFAIADKNFLVDISKTEEELAWKPKQSDEDMLYEAFHEYKGLKSR